ncbi:MAG: SsrA-binding protein SmpB [Chloroflexi bacterium]|nr:SsrA-binding protein SmpB [Chloroflexota bacterium]
MNGHIQKVVATNRKAYHDYFIAETYEAGLALTGTEIKSVRAGKVSLREGYAKIERGEAWLVGVHIAPYEQGSYYNPDSRRSRKLLLHRSEIDRLRGKLDERGLTLIPLRVYLKGGRAKVELGLARGKKLYDKREAIAERDAKRQIERAMKQ